MEFKGTSATGTSAAELGGASGALPTKGLKDAFASVHNAPHRHHGSTASKLAQKEITRVPFASLAVRVVDGLAIVVASVVSGIIYHELVLTIAGDLAEYLGVGILMAVLFTVIAQSTTSPHVLDAKPQMAHARKAAAAWIAAFMLFILISFLLKLENLLSRGAIFTFFFAGMATVVFCASYTPKFLARLHLPGTLTKRKVILLGSEGGPALSRIESELASAPYSDHVIVPVAVHCSESEWLVHQRQVIRRVCDLSQASDPVDVVLAAAEIPKYRLQSLVQSLAPVPRSLLIIPDESTAALLQHRIVAVGSGIAVEIQRAPLTFFQQSLKRVMDLAVASALAVVFSPLLVAIAIAIKIDSPGPVLYRQNRYGYRGDIFTILKFRTMTTMDDGNSIAQAKRNDERVTRLGRVLRRTSFDELPQLINVLRGEMSLVGPRPHAISHNDIYSKLIENYDIRLHIKPGMTGWAQVHGLRGETARIDLMSRRVEFDLWYAKNGNFFLDCTILVRTIFEVMRQRNAY